MLDIPRSNDESNWRQSSGRDSKDGKVELAYGETNKQVKPRRTRERDLATTLRTELPGRMDSSNSSRERDQSRICVETIEEWNKVKQNFTDSMAQLLNAKLGDGASAEKDALLAHLMQVSVVAVVYGFNQWN